jgi:hypothetical protein
MKRFLLPAALVILLPASALAVECANGVVRAGSGESGEPLTVR